MNKSSNQQYLSSDKKLIQLPLWITPNSNLLNPLYKRVWEIVRERQIRPGFEELVDTNKIFPILLTSQLSTQVLGYIWNLSNQKYAGQLTEQELYIVLALVALAQSSYSFNSLEVLNLTRGPPIPNLNLSLLNGESTRNESQYQNVPVSLNSIPCRKDTSVLKTTKIFSSSISSNGYLQNEPKFSSSQLQSHQPNLDGYQQFHSQPEVKFSSPSNSACSNDDFTEFQSAPIIPNWDPRAGSAIGSRLANHNLGVKKIADKAKKTVISKSINNQSRSGSSGQVPPVSRINKESFSSENSSELFPKCTIKSKTVILKDTAIRNSDPPDVLDKSIISKELEKSSEKLVDSKPHFNIPPPLTTRPINLPDMEAVSVKGDSSSIQQQDLMNLQSPLDKYSALRELIDAPETISILKEHNKDESNGSNQFSVSDDFGDFISAENPPINATKSDNNLGNVDLLLDFDTNLEEISFNTVEKSIPQPIVVQEISDALNTLTFRENSMQKEDEKTESVCNSDNQKDDALSINSIELSAAVTETLPRSGSVPSLDLKSFLPLCQDDEQQQIDNMHQIIYSEWKQYMESCIYLLQVAASIFVSISSEVILREVLSTAQGYNFLCDLSEVAAVCRRINYSHKEIDINVTGFDDLLMDIDRIWSEMEPFYVNIPIVTELPAWPLNSDDSITCALCLTIITSDRVTYNDYSYHATCANLWLFTVNSTLPTLRYPYTQTTIQHAQSLSHTS